MTEFGEQFTLHNVCIKSFYKIPLSLCVKCVLLNDGTKSVVKLQDRKLVHSWNLTHPHVFTSPAVYHRSDETVYCVMDSKNLLKWSLSDDELKLKVVTKAKFQETIFAVLPVKGQAPIILFSSGQALSCDTLDSYETPIGESFVSRGEKIIWADTIPQDSAVTVVCVTSKKNKTQFHTFNVAENNVSSYNVQTLSNGTEELINYCLNKHTHSLYTIWSSGAVLSHSLAGSNQLTLLTIPNAHKEIFTSIDCIDSHHIVLFKSNSELKETYLEIWDLKFSAIKAKKMLKIWPANSNQISVSGSSVYLLHNEELVEVLYRVEQSTLASAVGKSLPLSSKPQEFSWCKGKLSKLSNSENIEEMDTSDLKEIPSDPTVCNAKRLIEEGSDFLNYIPESELVRLLRYSLRLIESGRTSTCKRSKQPPTADPNIILNAIFSASFTDAFLVQFIKKLSIGETIITLEVLLKFFNHQIKVPHAKPSDFQLSNWMFLVYQAHMEALLLSKDKKCMKLLKRLDDCISAKVNEYEEYDCIQNCLLVLEKEPNMLPEQYMVDKYCIEYLET